jgi:hypothetical protein
MAMAPGEGAEPDGRGAGRVVEPPGRDAGHQPGGEDGGEATAFEQRVDACEPGPAVHEPLDRPARGGAREQERREPAGDGAAEGQRRATHGPEGETTGGGEHVPGNSAGTSRIHATRAMAGPACPDVSSSSRRPAGECGSSTAAATNAAIAAAMTPMRRRDTPPRVGRCPRTHARNGCVTMGTVEDAPAVFDVSCVAHVHTTYSDGTATVPELLAAAREAGAEAVLLTDHDSLGARRDGWEGNHDGVFLLVGTEVSPKQGHYLAFGVEREIRHTGRSAREIASAVRAAGGVGFAAHPFSVGGRMLYAPLARRIVLPHGWPALEDADGCDGIELWSLTTDAAEGWRTPAEAWRWLRDPEAAVAGGPPAGHLRRWDALSTRRRLPALGGLDGHAPGLRVRGRVRSPLSHARTFGLLRTHLLCERPLGGTPMRIERPS